MPKRIHWRCFHCEKVCKTPEAARLHFGPSIYREPICKMDEAAFREMERMLQAYREEDTDLHRQIARMESNHQVALRREEEKGYERGLRDGKALEQEERKARQARGTELLVRLRGHLYNSFEPDNQSAIYKEVDAFLKETGR